MATKKTGTHAPVAKRAVTKAPAKKSAGAKAPATKDSATKAPATKTATKPPAAKTPATKAAGRKYSPAASEQVERELHEMKQGKLKSGSTGQKITNPKQAIAIGLSEARRAGKKVPPNPNGSKKK